MATTERRRLALRNMIEGVLNVLDMRNCVFDWNSTRRVKHTEIWIANHKGTFRRNVANDAKRTFESKSKSKSKSKLSKTVFEP